MCFGSERFARQRTETGNTKTYYSFSVMRQAVSSFEKSVFLHQSKEGHTPEDDSLMVYIITNMF